jgi:hypothetical protein
MEMQERKRETLMMLTIQEGTQYLQCTKCGRNELRCDG